MIGAFNADDNIDEDPDGEGCDGTAGVADAGFPKFVVVMAVSVSMVVGARKIVIPGQQYKNGQGRDRLSPPTLFVFFLLHFFLFLVRLYFGLQLGY